MAITRPTVTDDDGSGTTGSVLNAAFFTDLYDRIDAFVTDWTTYTPTWTASSGGTSIGNGTIAGRYQKIGATVLFEFELTFGSSTNPGTGTYTFSLPVTANAARGRGVAVITDASTRFYDGFWLLPSTSTLAVYYDTGSAVTQAGASGAPVTWADTDSIKVSGFYIAA